ncbi:putative damage-inducible protein DinB [Gillisia sp. Hel_I_86]|uniref:DinB family protein n=1 Tax=Gillisia sp. Hel_I_86 TaxID=1249981 RepID=UPI00119B3A07|nr:DinB family protein [Gillisia sp. Hel_I_86]TVZ26920.1 putative damage-inducible protein DinB [Gillisia sp. Hel_I_86]
MDTLKQLRDELTFEYTVTKKFFDNYPEKNNNYAPHEKSMKMIDLVTHIASIFGWPVVMLDTSELDISEADQTEKVENKMQLKALLEKEYKASISALEVAAESDLEPRWGLTMKGEKLMEWTKYGAIRHALDQITHHRAQLGVYYRLLDIPVPASYGPSADDQNF